MFQFVTIAICLGVAAAAPEADPWYLYGHHAYHPFITSIGGLTTYSNGAVVPTNTPAVAHATAAHLAAKTAITGHPLGKREAEADPYLYYGLHYPHVTSVGGLTSYSNGAVVPFDPNGLTATAAHLATKAVYPYGHLIGKREAEAEPEADPWLYYANYPAVTSVGGLTTYSNGAVVPTDLANQAATHAHLATTYPRAHGYGFHLLGKREAEAEPEADPWLYYAQYPAVTSAALGGFSTYSNGAVVPTDPANQAATHAHLATTYPRALGYGLLGGYWG